MSGIWRRGFAAAVSTLSVPAVAMLLLVASPAHAESEIEAAMAKPAIFAAPVSEIAPDATEVGLASDTLGEAIDLAKVWAADFHPETDRWTERNNRIKLTLFGSALFFGQNLRINHDGAVGLRVSWEVPGFIAIRLDSVLAPFSHLRVRNVGKTTTGDSNRNIRGIVDCTSLSIAIFNPELSAAPNLAMWAGFGPDVWSYHYDQLLPSANGVSRRYQYVDFNIGANVFFDLEYKLADQFHIGTELREHVVYAPQTERGRFYKVDNLVNGIGLHTVGSKHSRNQNTIALSAVHEFQLHVSIVF